MNRSEIKGHLSILGTTIIFGFNGPVSKLLISPEGISPWVHMFCRFAGATLLFWLISIFTPRERIRKEDRLRFVAASLTGVLFNQGIFAIGISMTSPMNQSLITTMGPVITMILAAFFLHEPITWKKAIGVLLGGSGVMILIFAGGRGPSGEIGWGELISLLATLSYCLYLTLFKDIIARYSPVTLMKWMFLISLIIVSPVSIPHVKHTAWQELPTLFYIELGYVVLMATFVAYFLLPVAQKYLRPTVVSTYNYGIPVVATAAALAWGLEYLSVAKGLAALLVLMGVYLVTGSKSRITQLREKAERNSKLPHNKTTN